MPDDGRSTSRSIASLNIFVHHVKLKTLQRNKIFYNLFACFMSVFYGLLSFYKNSSSLERQWKRTGEFWRVFDKDNCGIFVYRLYFMGVYDLEGNENKKVPFFVYNHYLMRSTAQQKLQLHLSVTLQRCILNSIKYLR